MNILNFSLLVYCLQSGSGSVAFETQDELDWDRLGATDTAPGWFASESIRIRVGSHQSRSQL